MNATIDQREKVKPHQLRKKIKRLTNSRDNSKAKNRDKAQAIKDYQDRLRELTKSRDKWKQKLKEEKQNSKRLENMLHRRDEMLGKLQNDHAELFKEIQYLKKKI